MNSHHCLRVTERLYARMRLVRNEQPKQQLAAVEWQHSRSLRIECGAIFCFKIGLCDSSSPLLARFGTGDLFFSSRNRSDSKKESVSAIFATSSVVRPSYRNVLRWKTFSAPSKTYIRQYQHYVDFAGGGDFVESLLQKILHMFIRCFVISANSLFPNKLLTARRHSVWTVQLPSLPGLSTVYFCLWDT